VTFADLGPREVAEIARHLSLAVRDGKYRPAPTRAVTIPKPAGGTRTLRLPTLWDRIVASALQRALDGFWEGIFLPGSYGFRRGHGVWRMLAELEATMIHHNRRVLVNDDVRKAFDSVRIDRLLEAHARHVRDRELLDFIGIVVRGHQGTERKEGIDQGNPYSPTALNVLMHGGHDPRLAADPGLHPFWFRYADNLVYLAQNVPEGRLIRTRCQAWLQEVNLELKGVNEQDYLMDLASGEGTELLGFTIRLEQDRLRYDPNESAWRQLELRLTENHMNPAPQENVANILRGWANAYGPALESSMRRLARLRDLLRRYEYREIDPNTAFIEPAQSSWNRWPDYRRNILREYRARGGRQ
jgi:hypothetical protein